MAVVHHDGASVAAQEIGKGDCAVRGSDYGRAHRRRDVDAGVEGAFPVKRIDALTKGTGDLTFDRPEVRG